MIEEFSFEEIKSRYEKFIDLCHKFNCLTRSQARQRELVAQCEIEISLMKSFKKQAIEKESEFYANHFFHMQCMLNAMNSSLRLWLNVKKHSYHDAWVDLINAQEYVEVALKTNDYQGIRNLEKHLRSIETAIFPGFALYNSVGCVETVGNCSICNSNFLSCDHIENKIYTGQLCLRIDKEIIEIDHTALVTTPKDKRCITLEVKNDEGEKVNYFTWEVSEVNDASDSQSDFRMVVFSNSILDLN